MRLVLEQGLAPRAPAILRADGFDAVHVSEIAMERWDDQAILEWARNENRVCITLDHDFHAHLALTKQGNPSVMLMRVQGLEAPAQAKLIRVVCAQCGEALRSGAAVSADGEHIRVRRLPLR